MEFAILCIEGDTIRLRDPVSADLATYRHWHQPGHAWQALNGPYYARPTPTEVDKKIVAIRKRIESGQWPTPRARLVIADKQTNALVGMVSRYWISEETHWAAQGIVIYDSAAWRTGIGYEALGLWTDYLFAQCADWVRLDLRTWSGNLGMIGLARKLGYQEEARFRQARIVDGIYYDGLGFGILRTEWVAQFPAGFAAALAAKSSLPVAAKPDSIRQGDIYWIKPSGSQDAALGNHPHPYVVVQEDHFNRSRVPTVIVCALTSNPHQANEPGNLLLEPGEANLPRQSAVVVSKISTVDKAQLGAYIGSLNAERVAQILAGIRFQQSSFFQR